VLRKIFGPKREEVRGWKVLNSVEMNYCFCSPDIIKIMKLWRIISTSHVARTGKNRNPRIFWCGNLKDRDDLEVFGVNGKIMFHWS
jgi:hypothetical protein